MVMRSNKRYSNVTYSKRVDHEAGRHHAFRAHTEPEVCKTCGSVYADRRWVTAEAAKESIKFNTKNSARLTICPACHRQSEGVPSGYVYVKGAFLKKHLYEIERLMLNEAERAAEDNPTARIMERVKSNEQLTIATTTEHLAQRLGHALEKAYGGDIHYEFSHENKLSRVWWQRD
jgi:NMD protein affecting ribosome stability and mRNA decay